MAEYFGSDNKYRHRLDCIYDTLPTGDFQRNDKNPTFHAKYCACQHIRDWFGEYVIISNLFAYFGKESSAIHSNLLMWLPERQEYKSFDGNSSKDKQIVKQIMDEVGKLWNFQDIIQNRPHDDIRSCDSKGCKKK